MVRHGGALRTLRYVKPARHKGANSIWFYLYGISQLGKFRQKEHRLEATRVWEEGKMGSHCALFTGWE